jgi:hypothetical protein
MITTKKIQHGLFEIQTKFGNFTTTDMQLVDDINETEESELIMFESEKDLNDYVNQIAKRINKCY